MTASQSARPSSRLQARRAGFEIVRPRTIFRRGSARLARLKNRRRLPRRGYLDSSTRRRRKIYHRRRELELLREPQKKSCACLRRQVQTNHCRLKFFLAHSRGNFFAIRQPSKIKMTAKIVRVVQNNSILLSIHGLKDKYKA